MQWTGGVLNDWLGIGGVADGGQRDIMKAAEVSAQGLGIAKTLVAPTHHSCLHIQVHQSVGPSLPL